MSVNMADARRGDRLHLAFGNGYPVIVPWNAVTGVVVIMMPLGKHVRLSVDRHGSSAPGPRLFDVVRIERARNGGNAE